jgi:hypothetical protein
MLAQRLLSTHAEMGAAGIALVKLGTALVAVVACYRLSRGASRWASALLGLCAALSVCAYFQFGHLPAGLVHRWEMFHYYVGSKYHAELGYENLYRCTAVADAEDGLVPDARRLIRDLETDGLLHASQAVAEPQRCKASFSAGRWSAFRGDVRFFRRGLGKQAWADAQLDHGYNPPPLWTATWGELTELVPASLWHLQLLAAADVALMLGVLAALGLGFGWRVAALGAVFWGTQAASEVGWTGGGLGRQDWLFLCVAGVALLHRQKFGWGGAALACAGLLRLFPLLLLLGPALVWLARIKAREPTPLALRRFALGSALALSVGVGLSVAHSGASDYRQFWSHIQLRREAIVNNHMGLKTLLSAAPLPVAISTHLKSEPSWVEERRARLQSLRIGHVAILAAALGLVGAALWQARRAWVGAALATVLIPLTLDPSNYYYSFFILLVPLVAQKRSLGVLLGVVAAGGQLLSLRFAAPELRFVALSWLYVGVSLVVALAFVRWPRLAFSLERSSTCKVTS